MHAVLIVFERVGVAACEPVRRSKNVNLAHLEKSRRFCGFDDFFPRCAQEISAIICSIYAHSFTEQGGQMGLMELSDAVASVLDSESKAPRFETVPRISNFRTPERKLSALLLMTPGLEPAIFGSEDRRLIH